MQMFQRKWLSRVLLLFAALAVMVSFTAVAQAGGEGDPAPPMEEGPPMGKPPMGKHPMGKPVKPIPELANCIGAIAWYDGNMNGVVDANEDAMDGASIVLMTEASPPPEDPPIGPDGNEIVMEEPPMGGMPPMGMPPMGKPPMGPPSGGEMPMGKPQMGPPPGGEMPMGKPQMGPPPGGEMPMGKPPMGPPPGGEMPMGKPPMGPPPGAKMPEKQMPMKPTPQYLVLDRQITRDGGAAVFCDLKPGTYILQGDATEGITIGPNRVYTILKEDGYQKVVFGFGYLNGSPETTNGNGAEQGGAADVEDIDRRI